jgi:16S rRNA (guanine527-N7)-methyltransferase
LGVEEAKLNVLLDYAQRLAGYEKSNVIGTSNLERILLEHVLDSLSCFLFSPLSEADTLIDVGSGGGLPGVPINILKQELETTLLEATGKKSVFLNEVIEGLSLRAVRAVSGRAENIAKEPHYRGGFDVATARAVDSLSVVFEYCVPFLEEGGYVIAMKGTLDKQEMRDGSAAARTLGAEIQEVVEVPYLEEISDKERVLVIARKLTGTPRGYPRKDGTPRKNPLSR